MIQIPTITFRTHAKRGPMPPPTPVGPPVLVSATYVAGERVTLVFDRAVDTSAMDATGFSVDDGPSGWNLGGVGAPERPTAQGVTVSLEILGAAGGSDVRLNTPEPSGIVAVDGGAAWAGVVDLVLPFQQ